MNQNYLSVDGQSHPVLRFWNGLIEPTVQTMSAEQFLKAKLLSSLLIFLAVVDLFLSPFIILRFYPDAPIWESPLFILYIGSLVAFLASYVLNRNGRYIISALIIIGFTWFVPFAGALAFPSMTMLYLSVIYLIGVVLFGRILFTNTISSIITIICALSILVLPLIESFYTYTLIQLPFIGFLNITVLLLLFTYHNAKIEDQRRDELLHVNTSLRTSEERFRSLVENAAAGVYMVNNNFQFIYNNTTFADILQYTVDELNGLDFRKILTQESRAMVADYYQKRQQGQKVPTQYETQVLRKDGEPRWVQISASVIHNVAGGPFTIGQMLDIHDQKMAEDALRASEEKLQALLQHSTDIVSILDKQGNLIYNSPAGTRIHGYSAEEFATTNTLDLIHPDDRDAVRASYAKLFMHPNQTQTIQYRYASKNGNYIWMEAVASNLYDHPAINGIVANSRDISARKKAEQELTQYREKLEDLVAERTAKLKASESLLRRIVESISEGIIILDEAYRITFWNGAMEKVSREKREDVVGKVIWEEFPHLVEQSVDNMMRQAMAGNTIHREDIPFYLADGTTGFTTETYLPVFGENGRNRVVGVVRDITDRKQKEDTLRATNEQLKEMDTLKTKFISDISHELRTPITNLNLYLDLLTRGRPEKRAQYETVIRQQSERLIDLLAGILDFSNVSSETQPQTGLLDFNKIISQSVADYQETAQQKALALTFTPAPSLPQITGVDAQLKLMIDNLVANAINYTMRGSITVSTKLSAENEFICLQVTDTGIGMNEVELQNCFASFYRGSRIAQFNTTPGAGMGLAVVKEIVAHHDGRVEVMSKLEQGTTFTIYLPITPPTA
jgi:PAS domain S-box-containing protein